MPEIQAREYLELVSERYGTAAPQALAGDFNLARPDVDALLAPNGYRAATTGPTMGGHDPRGSEQIDMVYFARDGSQAGSSGTASCDIQASDHCHVVAIASP